MQAVLRRTFLVRPATAASRVIDSSRGLPNSLSPTQTASKRPERSASSASWSIVSTVVAPKRIPRLGSVNPIRIRLPLGLAAWHGPFGPVGEWDAGEKVEDGPPALLAALGVEQVARAFDHVELRLRYSRRKQRPIAGRVQPVRRTVYDERRGRDLR